MFLVGLISWWYGRGWIGQWKRMASRFKTTLDFFSVGQLLATLFAPFRQISATSGNNGSFSAAMRAAFDKLISRIIGAIVRFFTILAGLVVISLQAVYELIIVIAWWFVPVVPLVGFVLLAIGWVPVWM